MNLFNRKTLKRHIKADPIPSDHLAALEAWAELISSGRIERLKETALHGQFASKIVEGVLGYHGPAGGADYNVSTEQNILRGSVDLARESQRLRVEVQPTLTESVAVGAALANSATGLINPVAGLVTYLAQKIMQDPIEKLFSYEYAVTGAWKDPQVDKLASREPERDSAQPLSR